MDLMHTEIADLPRAVHDSHLEAVTHMVKESKDGGQKGLGSSRYANEQRK